MEKNRILIDTCVLIDNFRNKSREKSLLVHVVEEYKNICISSITEFEIYVGATGNQLTFWENILKEIKVFPFDSKVAHTAVVIQKELKKTGKTVALADLFIGATAVAHNLPLATFNVKHFELIDKLQLINSIN